MALMAPPATPPGNRDDDDPFADVRHALAKYKPESYHRLVPTALMERSPLFRPALAIVKVNPDDPRDVYPTPGSKDGTVCLHTQTLERIGNALGIDWLGTQYERDKSEPYLVTAHVTAEYIDAVGQRRKIVASATTDLRDGSIAANLLGGGLSVGRQFINERTEARARNRVVRKVTGMPSSFKKDELTKPFVALRWRLDESDPDVKRAIIAQGVGAADHVFGRRSDIIDVQAISAGHSGPDDDDEDQREGNDTVVTEPPEPEIPGESTPEPSNVQALVAQIIGRTPRTGGAAQPSTDEQQAAVGIAMRDALGLKGMLSPHAMNAIRLGIARFIYGTEVRSVRDLTIGQAKTLAAMAWTEIATVYNFWLDADPKAQIVRDELAGK